MRRSRREQGLIAGYIAERAPDTQEPEPLIAGWWTDRAAGLMFLRQATSPTMLILSAAAHHQLSGGLLLEARLKGVRRILFVAADGSIVKQVDVVSALVRMLQSVSIADPVHRATYDDLFADIYTLIGDRMRLPSADFVPGRVLILIGSLGGGGRRAPSGLYRGGAGPAVSRPYCVARCYGGGAADFYKPQLDAAGVASYVISLAAPEYESPEIIDIRNRLAERYLHLNALSIFHMIFHHALLIRELRPEVVHTWLDYSNTLGGVAADLVGVPRLVLSGRSLAPDNLRFFSPIWDRHIARY